MVAILKLRTLVVILNGIWWLFSKKCLLLQQAIFGEWVQREIIGALTTRFNENLRSSGHNHLITPNREAINEVVIEKTEQGPNGDVDTIQPNFVNSLAYAIVKHFVGRTTLYNYQSMEALLGMERSKICDFK